MTTTPPSSSTRRPEELPAGVQVRALRKLQEPRGDFIKLLMREHVGEDSAFGEIYVTTAVNGGVRGAHFHRQTNEWFCLLQGKCDLWMQASKADSPAVKLPLDADEPLMVFVPAGIAHAFAHVGTAPCLLLAYSDRPYDPEDTDTYPHALPPGSSEARQGAADRKAGSPGQAR